MSSSRIAFIGGTRFIGHAAAACAVLRGHDVTVIHRGVHRSEVEGVRSIAADRADPAALRAALTTARPDVVVDTRAMTAADTTATLDALRGVCDALVVLSSQDVYAQFGALNGLPAPPPEPVVTESSPLTVPYPFRGLAEHDGGADYDKKDVERLVTGARLRSATILRLPAVYGPRDPARRFGAIVDALDGRKDDGKTEVAAIGRVVLLATNDVPSINLLGGGVHHVHVFALGFGAHERAEEGALEHRLKEALFLVVGAKGLNSPRGMVRDLVAMSGPAAAARDHAQTLEKRGGIVGVHIAALAADFLRKSGRQPASVVKLLDILGWHHASGVVIAATRAELLNGHFLQCAHFVGLQGILWIDEVT